MMSPPAPEFLIITAHRMRTVHNQLAKSKSYKTIALLLCILALNGCYPSVRYEQYYAPETSSAINLSSKASADPWRMSVEPHIVNDVVKVSLSTIRLGDSLPAIEIPCQAARLSTSKEKLTPISGSTLSSEYDPPRREIPFCTDLYRPVAMGYEHPAYTQGGLRYDAVLAFSKPANVTPFITDSAIEAVVAKTRNAFGRYDDWYELYLPSIKVEGDESFQTQAISFRFQRKVRESWQIKWFWPLVSKG